MAPECWSAEILDFDTVFSGPFYNLFRGAYSLNFQDRSENGSSTFFENVSDYLPVYMV
jgi:hypothetical protein